MTAPVVTFFNNKGGVGKTSLAYHLACMLAQSKFDQQVLVCDLDPQANLTASFLDEDKLESLWGKESGNKTIYQCVKPLAETSGIQSPEVFNISDTLGLIPGDLALESFDDLLTDAWPRALDNKNLHRYFSILTAFWQIIQQGAKSMNASVILVDVGPNLGALNRSALIASDYVISPLGADLFSLQGLRNLGPKLQEWRKGWSIRLANWPSADFPLPKGEMKPSGYMVQQHGVRLDRPIRAYDKWINRMPETYAKHLLENEQGPYPDKPENDPNCLATVKHYRSLVPMAQEARKPIFELLTADGAIGSHAAAVERAYKDFENMAKSIVDKTGLK